MLAIVVISKPQLSTLKDSYWKLVGSSSDWEGEAAPISDVQHHHPKQRSYDALNLSPASQVRLSVKRESRSAA